MTDVSGYAELSTLPVLVRSARRRVDVGVGTEHVGMTVENLEPYDALCLWIGRVAQAHVHLDNRLRRVHQSLLAPSLGVYLTNQITSTEVLVEDCRLMMPKADIPDHLMSATEEVFKEVRAANRVRNRVVHDMWLNVVTEEDQSGEGVRWWGFQHKRGELTSRSVDPPRDLTFASDAWNQINRVSVRVLATDWAMRLMLPFYRGSWGDAHPQRESEDLAVWVAVMRDRFTMNDDGSFMPHPPD